MAFGRPRTDENVLRYWVRMRPETRYMVPVGQVYVNGLTTSFTAVTLKPSSGGNSDIYRMVGSFMGS